jgi:hypothetical protein
MNIIKSKVNGFDVNYVVDIGEFSGETPNGYQVKRFCAQKTFWAAIKNLGIVQQSPALVKLGDWLDIHGYKFTVSDASDPCYKAFSLLVEYDNIENADKLNSHLAEHCLASKRLDNANAIKSILLT